MDLDILLSIEYWEQYSISSYENLNLVLDIYRDIINYGDRNLKYCERHHMVPKSFDADLMSDSNNIIICTYEEHFNIHKLLAKCFSGIFKNKMVLHIKDCVIQIGIQMAKSIKYLQRNMQN